LGETSLLGSQYTSERKALQSPEKIRKSKLEVSSASKAVVPKLNLQQIQHQQLKRNQEDTR
jgi:hypothetical protein